MRFGCENSATCPINEYRYCGTSVGISIGSSAGVKAVLDIIENQIGSYNAALSVSLPIGSGGPLVGIGAAQTAPAGGCDNVAYALGPKIMTAIGATPTYPLGKWQCTKRTFDDMKGKIPDPYLASPTHWYHKTAKYGSATAMEQAVSMGQYIWEDQTIRLAIFGAVGILSMGLIQLWSGSSKEDVGMYDALI